MASDCLARQRCWSGFLPILKDRAGSTAIELALVFPVLITILFAIVAFGITLNNYIELANGVASGARILSISRSASTPYTSTRNAVTAAAVNLNSATLKANLVISINGSACTSDALCQSALTTAGAGSPATVSASYPCTLGILKLSVTNCQLTSQSTEAVE